MATGKKFYWLKLKKEFMESDKVDYIMSLPDGANYIVLYEILCLKSVNLGGRLCSQIGSVCVQWDENKIQRETKWFKLDTIRVAFELFKNLGLIYIDRKGVACITDFNNLVGNETDYARQKSVQRANKNSLPTASNSVDSSADIDIDNTVDKSVDNDADNTMDTTMDNSVDNVHTEIRDKRIENRDKILDIHSFVLSCADAPAREIISAADKERYQRKYQSGAWEGLFLSDAQFSSLLDILSLDEFDHYVDVVTSCEVNGKSYTKKTHYEAILEMAMKDRGFINDRVD